MSTPNGSKGQVTLTKPLLGANLLANVLLWS